MSWFSRGGLITVPQGIAPVESIGQFPFQVASGVGATAYVGVVGVAPRTLVRQATALGNAAGTLEAFFIARALTGGTPIGQQLKPVNTATGAVQATCVSGATTAGLSTLGLIFQSVTALAVGSSLILFSNANQLPVFLFPGDAFIVTGVNASGIAQIALYTAIAEFAS